MLKLFFCGLMPLVCMVTVTTASAKTLLRKTTSPGYVMQEAALYTTCTLDDSGLLTTTNEINGLISKRTSTVQIGLAGLDSAIATAASGTIKRPAAMIADVPVSTYVAYKKMNDGKLKKVFLYEESGSQENSTYNENPYALSLRRFMDELCK